MNAEIWLVPAGATFNGEGTEVVSDKVKATATKPEASQHRFGPTSHQGQGMRCSYGFRITNLVPTGNSNGTKYVFPSCLTSTACSGSATPVRRARIGMKRFNGYLLARLPNNSTLGALDPPLPIR